MLYSFQKSISSSLFLIKFSWLFILHGQLVDLLLTTGSQLVNSVILKIYPETQNKI